VSGAAGRWHSPCRLIRLPSPGFRRPVEIPITLPPQWPRAAQLVNVDGELPTVLRAAPIHRPETCRRLSGPRAPEACWTLDWR
jgi:hypothetical protein